MQRQREVIKSSYNLINVLEREKSDAEAGFKRDKENVEAGWKAEKENVEAGWQSSKETIKRNWNHVKYQNESARSSVRNSIMSSREALNNVFKETKWQDNLVGGTLNSLAIPNGRNIVEQISVYQSATEELNKRIISLLENYKNSSRNIVIISLLLGFLIAIVCSILIYSVNNYVNGLCSIYILLGLAISCPIYFLLSKNNKKKIYK